nr:hypothetical protein GCM10017611_11310 [Rhodococcus wratislaviensis]
MREGSFDDIRAIRAAGDGVHGVFAMRVPVHREDLDSENVPPRTRYRRPPPKVETFIHISAA